MGGADSKDSLQTQLGVLGQGASLPSMIPGGFKFCDVIERMASAATGRKTVMTARLRITIGIFKNLKVKQGMIVLTYVWKWMRESEQ